MFILSIFTSDGSLVPVACSRHIHVILGIKDKLWPRRYNVTTLDEYDTIPNEIDVDLDYSKVTHEDKSCP